MRRQDIHLSDVDLRNQFVSLFLAGDYIGAFSILNDNPQLDSKKFVAEILNMLSAKIMNIQDLYYTNVDDFLASEVIRFQVLLDNYKRIGTYNNVTQYKLNNFVIYNNLVYLCILQPPVGTLPTNTTYWALIGLRGEKGAAGIDTSLKYAWNPSVTYNTKDVVEYDDILYVAKSANINKIPSSSVEWEIFLEVNKRYIHTDSVGTGLTTGDIWFMPIMSNTWDNLDSQNLSWDELDSMLLTWNEFERGEYSG